MRSAARRLARRSFATLSPPTIAEAVIEVAEARLTLDRVRRDVGCGRDGNASLAAAEYALDGALRRYEAALDQGDDT